MGDLSFGEREQARYCTECGGAVGPTAKYCSQCAHPLQDGEYRDSLPSTAPAGWYPNPENSAELRYWSGSDWTEYRAPIGQGTTSSWNEPLSTVETPLTKTNAIDKPFNWGAAIIFALLAFGAGSYGWGALFTTTGCEYVVLDAQAASAGRLFMCAESKWAAGLSFPGAPVFERVPFGIALAAASLVLWGISWLFVAKARMSP